MPSRAFTNITPSPKFIRTCGHVLWLLTLVVLTGISAHLAVLLWAHHEFTPAESMVALQAQSLAHGSALYHNPDSYPYTVSPYGIVFYALSAALQFFTLSPLAAGRFISFLALAGIFFSAKQILWMLVANRYARATGIILIAAGANVIAWGGIGQTDMLACALSFAAFASFLSWYQRPTAGSLGLVACGVLLLLAAFTKQTAIAEIPAILLFVFKRNRQLAFQWALSVATTDAIIYFFLNFLTDGQYFANTILANINPFSLLKFKQQVHQFVLANGGLLVVSLLGARFAKQQLLHPLYLYTAAAFAIWLATSPKIGSELNYQIEIAILCAVCSAVALDRLDFFPKLFHNDPGWVPLLQIPLLLYFAVNFGLTAKIINARIHFEQLRRTEARVLEPFLTPNQGRVLSGNFDLLLSSHRAIEVDPWFYMLLTNAHRINPKPLLKDLQSANFGTIILDQDVFANHRPAAANEETPFLPALDLQQVRRNYVLVRHVNSPYLDGDYIYQPRPSALRSSSSVAVLP